MFLGMLVVNPNFAQSPAQLISGTFNGVLAEGDITTANLTGELSGQPLTRLMLKGCGR